jgi:hypothetical protein
MEREKKFQRERLKRAMKDRAQSKKRREKEKVKRKPTV